MKQTLIAACVSVLLSTGLAYAQSQKQQQQPQRDRDAPTQPAAQGEKVTLTGCLMKGTDANQYVITDKESKEKTTFPGPAQLDRFVDQTVKLMGTMMVSDKGDKVFRPESIASVAASC